MMQQRLRRGPLLSVRAEQRLDEVNAGRGHLLPDVACTHTCTEVEARYSRTPPEPLTLKVELLAQTCLVGYEGVRTGDATEKHSPNGPHVRRLPVR